MPKAPSEAALAIADKYGLGWEQRIALAREIDALVATETERCAKVALDQIPKGTNGDWGIGDAHLLIPQQVARAIRGQAG